MYQEQTYNSKCNPLPNEPLGFSWDGHAYSTCNTVDSDWFSSKNRVFSLVETMSLISRSLCDFSQHDFNQVHSLHIYMCHTPPSLWKNPQAYTI